MTRKPYYLAHDLPLYRWASNRDNTTYTALSRMFRSARNFLATASLSHRAGAQPARLKSLFAYHWGHLSWAQYRGRLALTRAEANTRLPVLPNNRSVRSHRSFLKSPERFGRTRQRLTLRPRAIVRSALRRCISLVIGNGPATQSPPSSLKSCAVTRCATSRSFPNGSHRSF